MRAQYQVGACDRFVRVQTGRPESRPIGFAIEESLAARRLAPPASAGGDDPHDVSLRQRQAGGERMGFPADVAALDFDPVRRAGPTARQAPDPLPPAGIGDLQRRAQPSRSGRGERLKIEVIAEVARADQLEALRRAPLRRGRAGERDDPDAVPSGFHGSAESVTLKPIGCRFDCIRSAISSSNLVAET